MKTNAVVCVRGSRWWHSNGGVGAQRERLIRNPETCVRPWRAELSPNIRAHASSRQLGIRSRRWRRVSHNSGPIDADASQAKWVKNPSYERLVGRSRGQNPGLKLDVGLEVPVPHLLS